MMISYIVKYCSPVNTDYHIEMCLTTERIIFHSLARVFICIQTRDGTIQPPSVSIHHVKNIMIWRYITAYI